MFKNEMNTDFNSDGEIKTKCGYIGLSLADNSININNILNKFSPSKEVYMGENEYEKNISCLRGHADVRRGFVRTELQSYC